MILSIDNGETVSIVFFHFQSLIYKNRYQIFTGITSCDDSIDYCFIDSLYRDYLCKIDKKKQFLKEKYDISTYIRRHPSTPETTINKLLHLIPKFYSKVVGLFVKPKYSYSVDISNCIAD